MTGFEQGFADTERAAASTVKSAANVARAARALERAAKTGSINAIRRSQSDLTAALRALTEEVDAAAQAWPFQPEEEEAYLQEHFAAELRQVAAGQGLDIHERDRRLIAHPSIVSVLAAGRAVRIDKKQVSTIRPSHLASLLLRNQDKPPRFNSGVFLESLHSAYKMLTRGRSTAGQPKRAAAPAVPLSNIYEALTLMPGQSREYSRMEFAQDLYRLDTDDRKETQSGAQLHFHTGRQSNITFVAPDGRPITYYNIVFTEPSNE